MSQHPSLRLGNKNIQHRSVLKRREKLKILKEQDKWKEEEDSIFGLPKVKTLRFKIKKEKPAPEAEAAETTPPGEEKEEKTEGAAVKKPAVKKSVEKNK